MTNNDAVTPVIGTILLVAITVLIGAIISGYIFGTAGNVDKTKTVAATSERLKNNMIQVTYHGGPDAVYVSELIVYDDADIVSDCILRTEPGTACTFYGVGSDYQDHIRVVAKFTNSNPQVILDVTV
jgi:archaeal flagellin N-terminal-like domain